MNIDELNEILHSENPNLFMIDLDENVYRESAGVSQSDLKLIDAKSLYHYRYQPKKQPTDAQLLGSAIHTKIFEPDLFESRFLKLPDINRRTKAGREEYAALTESGKVLLKRDDWDLCTRMKTAIKRNAGINRIIEACEFEKSSFVKDKNGLVKKMRSDGYDKNTHTIVDLKTTMDANPKTFQRDIFKWGYHWQVAYYTDIVYELTGDHPKFIIIAIEKSYPHESCQFVLSAKSIAIGRTGYRRSLNKLNTAHSTGNWSGYDSRTVVTPPTWLERLEF